MNSPPRWDVGAVKRKELRETWRNEHPHFPPELPLPSDVLLDIDRVSRFYETGYEDGTKHGR